MISNSPWLDSAAHDELTAHYDVAVIDTGAPR
jgi:hypothetical protein